VSKILSKYLIAALLIIKFVSLFASAEEIVNTYQVDGKFGLKKGNVEITQAKYNKMIRLKDESWLFMYKNKYGIMDNLGNILVQPIYPQAQRFVGRFAKLGAKGKYALYNEKAEMIAGLEYSKIELLYGKMFMVEKNHKYGIISFNGDILLAPVADDIYMPESNIIRISYNDEWYEITQSKEIFELPEGILDISEAESVKIKHIVKNPITSTELGLVSASDYLIKIFSSISPAYEKTVDELVLYNGADAVGVLLKPVWLLKFPFVYTRNYLNNFKSPNSGPLSNVKSDLKNKIK